MRFAFLPEEESFRSELRAWISDVLPEDWAGLGDGDSDEEWDLTLRLRKDLAARGWLTLAWPPEYGGQGRLPHDAAHLQ